MEFVNATVEVNVICKLAKELAVIYEMDCVKPEIILLCFAQCEYFPKFFMKSYGIDLTTIIDAINKFKSTPKKVIGEIKYSKLLNGIIRRCNDRVESGEITVVTTKVFFEQILTDLNPEHWFHRLLLKKSYSTNKWLDNMKLWEECLITKQSNGNEIHELLIVNKIKSVQDKVSGKGKREIKNMPKVLQESYCIDFSDLAMNDKLDPVIGRENEICRVINILCKRIKNNPVILGEPGIGKSALVEGLAIKIANGDVPEKLKNKTICSLSINNMLSGTKYRGDFEKRIQDLMEAVEKEGDIILFIDEIHIIVGAGKCSEDTVSLGNIIKPYLARGKITIIGATTLDEYKTTIEKDGALERRFQPIILNEPTTNETIQILLGIKEKYEKFHNLEIGESEIKYIVQLAEKYIPERRFPDKAIDLMDEACAFTINNMSESSKLSKEAIKHVVSGWKKLNVSEITTDQIAVISNLQKNIEQELFGQDEAVSKILQVIKLATFGVVNLSRPKASFLLIGATGVGKTYLAKLLAKYLNGDENTLVRLDMSEFKENNSISKIIGSPPGYVGFDKTSGITEKVRRNPSSIVLLDEVDKAHPDVLELLLQILDEGYITDSAMRKIDFKQCIIILTANSASYLDLQKKVGFEVENDTSDLSLINNVKKHIKPEILDRLDDVIVLNDLSESALMKVIQKNIIRLENSFLDRNYNISISDSVITYLFEYAKTNKFGVRQSIHFTEKTLSNAIIENILNGNITQNVDYQMIYINDDFEFSECTNTEDENCEVVLA